LVISEGDFTMPHFLQPFFDWSGTTWLSLEIRDSRWQFAVLEMVHLAGLAILLGTLVVIDLRLFGCGMRNMSTSQLARELKGWMRIGMVTVLGSGVLLFFGEPMKLYGSPSFLVKMVLLFFALLLQLTLFRKITAEGAGSGSAASTVIGTLSLALWMGVGLAGRAIGFL
jgi:Family of unknown function (DUF6644)